MFSVEGPDGDTAVLRPAENPLQLRVDFDASDRLFVKEALLDLFLTLQEGERAVEKSTDRDDALLVIA